MTLPRTLFVALVAAQLVVAAACLIAGIAGLVLAAPPHPAAPRPATAAPHAFALLPGVQA